MYFRAVSSWRSFTSFICLFTSWIFYMKNHKYLIKHNPHHAKFCSVQHSPAEASPRWLQRNSAGKSSLQTLIQPCWDLRTSCRITRTQWLLFLTEEYLHHRGTAVAAGGESCYTPMYQGLLIINAAFVPKGLLLARQDTTVGGWQMHTQWWIRDHFSFWGVTEAGPIGPHQLVTPRAEPTHSVLCWRSHGGTASLLSPMINKFPTPVLQKCLNMVPGRGCGLWCCTKTHKSLVLPLPSNSEMFLSKFSA